MGTTLLTLRQLVRSGAGLQPFDQLFTDAVLSDLISEANAIAEGEVRGPWRQATTTAVVSSVAPDITPLPADWSEGKAVFDSTGFELREVSISDALSFGPEQSGGPLVWAQDATAIRVRPLVSGDHTLTVVYYRMPVAPIVETMMPDDLARSVIVPKACELVHLRQGDRVLADAKATAYAAAMPRLRRRARGATGPMRARIRPGSWI